MITMARTGWTTRIWYLCFLLLLGYGLAGTDLARAEEQSVDDGLKVMQSFNELEQTESDLVKIELQQKRLIMFIMGVFLLLGVLTTASLGVAMVLFGKQVFIAHMVCAGLSVFLAIAHAVTAIVWFFPF